MAKLHVKITAEDHAQGSDGATATLVEYGDFQCPDCGMAYPMVKQIQKHFGSKLRFVYRNFPLTEIHSLAEPAAEAAEFAGAAGKFWEMHDAIFEHQRKLSLPMLVETVDRLGLHGEDARTAVEEQRFAKRIRRDLDGGVRSGVHGTPTYFINGEQYEGAWELEELRAAIDEVM